MAALDLALAPSLSPKVTMGKLQHLSEPLSIKIACRLLELILAESPSMWLDAQQTGDTVII